MMKKKRTMMKEAEVDVADSPARPGKPSTH
jgi:hypothetical protein